MIISVVVWQLGSSFDHEIHHHPPLEHQRSTTTKQQRKTLNRRKISILLASGQEKYVCFL